MLLRSVCRCTTKFRPTSAHMRRRTFRALFQCKFTIPSEQFYQLTYDEYTFLRVLMHVRANRVNRVLSACIKNRLWKFFCASAQMWHEIRPTSAHMRRRTFRALFQCKFTIPSEQFYQLSYDEYTFLSVLILWELIELLTEYCKGALEQGSESASAQERRCTTKFRPTSAHMRRRTFRALFQCKFTIFSELSSAIMR